MSAFDMGKLQRELERDEGRRKRPYLDCCGAAWNVCTCTVKGKLTVGVGWNLDANGLPDDVIDILRDRGIKHAIEAVDAIEPLWVRLDDARRRVLINMAFNLGPLGLSKFKRFLAALRSFIVDGSRKGDLVDEMKDSDWYKQVGVRGERLADLMRDGEP